MGVDYDVAVHAPDWPTMQALQQCLDDRHWPVTIGSKREAAWSSPLETGPSRSGLWPVTFEDAPVELEASAVTLSPTVSFGYTLDRPPDARASGMQVFKLHPQDVFKPVDINETLIRIGAKDATFGYGDRVLTLTFRSNIREWRAGFFIMAGLILCFHGYGFELQAGSHGSSDYADDLAKQVSNPKAWK